LTAAALGALTAAALGALTAAALGALNDPLTLGMIGF